MGYIVLLFVFVLLFITSDKWFKKYFNKEDPYKKWELLIPVIYIITTILFIYCSLYVIGFLHRTNIQHNTENQPASLGTLLNGFFHCFSQLLLTIKYYVIFSGIMIALLFFCIKNTSVRIGLFYTVFIIALSLITLILH